MQRISLIESIRNMEDNAIKAALLKVLFGDTRTASGSPRDQG